MRKHYNERAINGLFHSNETARIILQELSSMPRQDETHMETVEKRLSKSHPDVTRRDIVTLFKSLDDYGAGEFVPGRRGHPSRFRWEVDSVNVSSVETSMPNPREAPALNLPSPVTPAVLIQHRYQLRPDMMIALQLPSDLTPTEAHRLTQFILSLPFGDDGASNLSRVAGAQ